MLARLADAAEGEFSDKGYRAALVSSIAQRAGVSQGTVYNLVESKEALLQVLIEQLAAGGNSQPPSEVPVRALPPEDLARLIKKALAAAGASPVLEQAVASAAPRDVRGELEAIVAERYRVLEGSRRLLSLVESCAPDLPWLADLYFSRGRRGFHDLLGKYIADRAETRSLRSVEDPFVAARFINEAVTWFAWHRHGDPTGARIDHDLALRTAVDLVVHALLPQGGARAASS